MRSTTKGPTGYRRCDNVADVRKPGAGLHDRWLADDRVAWNVPPVNTLFKNDYSEIYPASERPPLEIWWNRSTPRA